MNIKKGKKITGIYCPEIHSEWRLFSDSTKIDYKLDKLLYWSQLSFTTSFPTSISDWEKCNKNYLSCLQSIKVSECSSQELVDIIRAKDNPEEEMKIDTKPSNNDNFLSYLRIAQSIHGISEEKLVDAYCASRIQKWSNSSIEEKYKIPIYWLRY